MSGVVERHVIVTWYTLEEKLPEEDTGVIATISGKSANGAVIYDHAIMVMYWCKEEGWYSDTEVFEDLTIHAWCDLDPYKG